MENSLIQAKLICRITKKLYSIEKVLLYFKVCLNIYQFKTYSTTKRNSPIQSLSNILLNMLELPIRVLKKKIVCVNKKGDFQFVTLLQNNQLAFVQFNDKHFIL